MENVEMAKAMRGYQAAAFRVANPEHGDREVRICKATGEPVEMLYEGFDEHGKDRGGSGGANGNPGWLCLHDDD